MSTRKVDKAEIDASPPGSMTIRADSSARVKPANCAQSLNQMLESMQSEHALVLNPLRLILVTGEVGNTVVRWQRALGLPEAGVSEQREGVAVAKHMSWGTNEKSARSIIILADYIAGGIAASNSVAMATLAHELGHVHDDFLRSLHMGFPDSSTPLTTTAWPLLCTYLAKITWSEYAAESVGAIYQTREDRRAFLMNDPLHLSGIHQRLRQAVWSYKRGERTLGALWGGAITELGDIFANLGRAIARLAFAENYEEALGSLVDVGNEAAGWKPVIYDLAQELKALGSKGYATWGAAPFTELQQIIVVGFEVVGLFPTYDGSNLHVRVP
jgi:hypothetical protein